MIHTEILDLAWQFITGTNETIFLTGKAGTGKTTFLKQLREKEVKNLAVAAPTGVAAINAGGVTLHSMFQLPFGPFIPDHRTVEGAMNKNMLLSRLRYNQDKLNFFRTLELLIIDEASMVPCYIVDAIDTILRSVRHNRNLPFGGLQVLFIGDLYQLQPVLKQEEWKILNNYYSSIFFFDSHVLRDNPPVVIELKKIFRQKDQDFIDILNGVRDNMLTNEQLQTLNSRLHAKFADGKEEGVITLTTHNNQADSINNVQLKKIQFPTVKFKATVKGNFPEQMFPAEEELMLKEGAQVMFVRNDIEGKRYFNGKIGTITEIDDDTVFVKCEEGTIEVSINTWENITYTHDPKTNSVKEETVGTFSQLPLRLAWAITIHKSQGLTFDKVIIDAANAFVKGQVYVALSRATTLEGLVLTSPVNSQFMGAHEDLKKLHEGQKSEAELKIFLEASKIKFLQQLLEDIFSFDHLQHTMSHLKKLLIEFEVSERDWLNVLINNVAELRKTADKFKLQIRQLLQENTSLELNPLLQKRLHDASVYFSDQLKVCKDKLQQHPVKLGNRSNARSADKQLGRIGESLAEILSKLDNCKEGFRMIDFNKWKKKLKDYTFNISSCYHSEKIKSGQDAENNTLYEMLAILRQELAAIENTEPYMIYSNRAIRSCCELLPGDVGSLLAVSGFGKQKVKQYGEKVVNMILEYCDESGLQPNRIEAPEFLRKKKEEGSLSETVMESLKLWKSGKAMDEIVKIRSLKATTIESHLATAIRHGKLTLGEVFQEKEIESLKTIFKGQTHERDLKTLFELSNGEFSYGKLRMFQAGTKFL